jgi:hypothetical protein
LQVNVMKVLELCTFSFEVKICVLVIGIVFHVLSVVANKEIKIVGLIRLQPQVIKSRAITCTCEHKIRFHSLLTG